MEMMYDQVQHGMTVDMAAILAHHDVVFRAPTHDPLYGLPIGNGDTGCLLWTEADRLHINLNKTDLWDDAAGADDIVCSWESENLTTCRHGAHLILDFGCPVFEMIFQNRYEGRLSLYDGTARINADTPFCKTNLTAFSSEEADVSVVQLAADFGEEMPLNLSLTRFGSRIMWYWYSAYKPGTEKGLDGTSSAAEDGVMKITQRLNGTVFCAAVLPVSDGSISMKTTGSHGTRAEMFPGNKHLLTLYLTIGVGKTEQEAETAAVARVKSAAVKGFDDLYREHAECWKNFWSKSFVCLPEKNDFLENLWYLNLYYANSQMKGKYPAHFCNGIWNTYYDFVPWNHFFHYNMQLATFPLEAAGHAELLEAYYDFRVNQLPMAKAFAEKYKHSKGAFYADVCDRYGRNADNVSENCTCGAQIAMMLYRHYLFTGDSTYLKEKALPVMKETAQFYLDTLQKAEDGYYHIYGTQGYEGSPLFDDSITDLAMIRSLFGALIDVVAEEEGSLYRERLAHLVPYTYTDMYDDEVSDGRFTRGLGCGEMIRGDRVLSVGKTHGTTTPIRRTFGNAAHDYYGFPDTEMAPLFPSGTVGIKDRGTPIYNAIYNSVCLHHPALTEGNALGRDKGDGVCMGWCMEPIYLARMGLGELLERHMENTITTWFALPQGFGYYTPTDQAHLRERWNQYEVINEKTREKRRIPTWNFRHFDYETLPILAAATNEMLMQSYDGTIRLFCAVIPTERYAFSLTAQGGFSVNAVYHGGFFDAWIVSTRGSRLSLAAENISEEAKILDEDGNALSVIRCGEYYETDTVPGMRIHVTNKVNLTCEREYEINMTAKKFGDAKLGEYPAMD